MFLQPKSARRGNKNTAACFRNELLQTLVIYTQLVFFFFFFHFSFGASMVFSFERGTKHCSAVENCIARRANISFDTAVEWTMSYTIRAPDAQVQIHTQPLRRHRKQFCFFNVDTLSLFFFIHTPSRSGLCRFLFSSIEPPSTSLPSAAAREAGGQFSAWSFFYLLSFSLHIRPIELFYLVFLGFPLSSRGNEVSRLRAQFSQSFAADFDTVFFFPTFHPQQRKNKFFLSSIKNESILRKTSHHIFLNLSRTL